MYPPPHMTPPHMTPPHMPPPHMYLRTSKFEKTVGARSVSCCMYPPPQKDCWCQVSVAVKVHQDA